MARRPSRSLTLLFACIALGGAHAAELGDARVASHIGQQLVADIELTALENAGAPVQVRIANPDVYQGANIAIPAVLSSLNLSVMQREGRQFLHVTSLKPVDSDHLHLYLELVDGGHRAVRLSTLWLSPDPNPAPLAPPPAVQRQVAPPAVPEPQPASSPPVRAAAVEHIAPPLRALAVERIVSRPARVVPPEPPRVRSPVQAALLHLPAAPKAAPAACAPKPSAEESACVALDAKNVALRAQIDQLEHKVKVLRGSMQGASTPPVPAVQPAKPEVVPAGPRPIKPRKATRQAEPERSGLPWLAIGIGTTVLLAGGAAWVIRRRRKQNDMPKPSAAVSREGIKSRLMGGP
jgi:hypothetical protein